jgi:hypothetical protein
VKRQPKNGIKSMEMPGTVVHTYNLITQEVEIRRIAVQAQAMQKVSKTPSPQKSWVWWYIPVIPAMQEA